MPPLELACPSCKSALRVPGAQPGRRVKCPRCHAVFTPALPPAEELVPTAEPVPEPAPAPAPTLSTPSAPADDPDFYTKLATAADPAPTAAPRKPQPTPGEPGNPLPLDDEPPARPRATRAAPRKPAAPAEKPARKKRPARDWDDDEPRPRGAINPWLLFGGLGVLAAGLLGVAIVLVNQASNRKAEEAAALVAQQERDEAAARRERELAAQRERELAARPEPEPRPPAPGPKPEPPAPEPTAPGPAAPGGDPGVPPSPPPPRPPVRPPIDPPVFPPADPPDFPPAVPPKPADPPKAKLAFPPVTPVAIKPAPLARDKVELKLPGKVTDACVGGGGRYWCLLLGDQKQLAVFDVNAAKVTRFIPVASGNAKLAAGMNKLVVAYPDAGTLVRFDLTTFEKEVTVKAPTDGTIRMVGMGSASAGPVMLQADQGGGALGRKGGAFLDLATLKPLDVAAPGGFVANRDAMHYRFSPDGRTIGWWCTSHSPGGLNVGFLTEAGLKGGFSEHTSVGFVLPSADGSVVTAGGVYGSTGKKLGGPDGYFFRTPAQEGRFYLTIPGGGAQVNTGKGDVDKPTVVYSTGEARALITLPDVALPAGNEAWAGTDFLADKKVLFTTEGKLIAVLAPTGDKLLLHRFDLEAALDKAGVDYLFVTSRPPAAVPGKAFKYPIAVKSKKGGPTFKLDAGPEGMKVAPDGTVTWTVPAGWSGSESVIVTVSDKSGQEVFHTFTLTPAPAGGGEAVAGPARPDPPRPAPAPPAPAPPADEPGPGIVRPAANPAKFTPTKAADKAEIKLPGTVDATCLGGGGRFVILRMPKVKQAAVLDVCEGKVAKYLPLPEDNAMLAAGNEHLFVLAPTADVIQRWSLVTFEKEVTVANPLKGARAILVGHATDGPLFVVGPNKALDPRTFKEVSLGKEANGRGMGAMAGHPSYPPTVRVSADGRVFAWHTRGLSPSGLSSMVIGESETRSHYEHTTVGAILPGPDGTLFTAGGLFTPELKPVGEKKGYQYWHHAPMPAAHGRFYLSVASERLPGRAQANPTVTLRMVGEEKPLVELGNLAGLDIPKDHNQTAARGLQLYDRVFLVPNAKALVVLDGAAEKVVIHRFDVEALMDKAGIDYLFVVSRPPGAPRGAKFSYKPEVKSKKGGVKVKLDAGPEGMTVAADGTVAWDVPPDFAESSAQVILTISDKSGQETFHTFTLPVTNRSK